MSQEMTALAEKAFEGHDFRAQCMRAMRLMSTSVHAIECSDFKRGKKEPFFIFTFVTVLDGVSRQFSVDTRDPVDERVMWRGVMTLGHRNLIRRFSKVIREELGLDRERFDPDRRARTLLCSCMVTQVGGAFFVTPDGDNETTITLSCEYPGSAEGGDGEKVARDWFTNVWCVAQDIAPKFA